MKLDFATPFVAAFALWRRDRALLLPIAGLLIFVPQYALLLLVPEMPRIADGDRSEAAMLAWSQALATWVRAHGLWYVAAPLMTMFATLTIATLYLDRARPEAGRALGSALALLPRYLLATILVSLPIGGLTLAALPAPVLAYVLALPVLYIFARSMLVAPVIVGERPVGAIGAIQRSWALTRGHGLILTGIYAATALAGPLAGSLFLAIGELAQTNPVLVAITAGVASLFAAGGALALALIQVVVYGRLASKGT